jgi:hypothetical protein
MGKIPRMTIDSLITIMFTHKSSGARVIMSKEHMRSQGFKSPDDADSLMMAYWATKFINENMEDQEDFRTPWMRRQDEKKYQQQQGQGNLFHVAGFR